MSRGWWRNERYGWGENDYPESRPRKAEGGIKSKSKRGAFGESWWAKRWIQVLESFNIGARLCAGGHTLAAGKCFQSQSRRAR